MIIEKGTVAKCTVIARPVFKLVVEIRFSSLIDTDSHTSDIGHWFGMTGFRILQHALSDSRIFSANWYYLPLESTIILLLHFCQNDKRNDEPRKENDQAGCYNGTFFTE